MSVISGDLFSLFVLIFADWLDPFGGICQLRNFLQNFNLVIRSIKIMRGWFHDFYCHIGAEFEIFCKPNCREVSPAELLNEHVSINEDLSNMARVVASNFIILDPFILAVIFIIEFPHPLSQVCGLLIFAIKVNLLDIVILAFVTLKVLKFFVFIVDVLDIIGVWIEVGVPSANFFFWLCI